MEQTASSYNSVLALIYENHFLLSTDLSLTEAIPFDAITFATENQEMENRSELFLSANNNKSYILHSAELLFPDLTLVSFIPRENYYSRVYNLIQILIVTLVLCILAGLLAISSLSRHNYAPIQQIISYIHHIHPTTVSEQNEYRFIMDFLRSSHSELEKQNMLLQNEYIFKLLNGYIPFQQIPPTIISKFNLSLPSYKNYVVLLSVSQQELDKWGKENDMNSADSLSMYQFILQNVFTELLSREFSNVIFCNHENTIAVIINVPDELTAAHNTLLGCSQQLLDFCSDVYHLSINIGISSSVPASSLTEAYYEAINALTFISAYEKTSLCDYGTLAEEASVELIRTGSVEQLINLVFSADVAGLENYFEEINTAFSIHRISPLNAKSLAYFFCYSTLHLRHLYMQKYGVPSRELDSLNSLLPDQPVPYILKTVSKAYIDLALTISSMEKSEKNNLMQDIYNYICNNYFDINLNLNHIADYFDLTPSYLSQLFRKEFGIGIIDHLYQIRIENAKTLLSTTNLKISEIACMVGFPDSNALIRIFKKQTGTTPGKYKELWC